LNCPACGKKNQPHWKFCLACGAELPRVGEVPAGPPVRYPPGLGPPPPQQPTAASGARGAGRPAVRIFLVVAFFMLAAGAGSFFFLRSGGPPVEPVTASSAPATPPDAALPAEEPLPSGSTPDESAAMFRGIAPRTAETAPPDQRAVILDVLRDQTRGPIRDCWEDHLRDGGTASGRINVQITVGADGKVSASVAGSDPSLAGTPVEACVLQAMSRLDFAGKLQPTGSFVLVYPVIFNVE